MMTCPTNNPQHEPQARRGFNPLLFLPLLLLIMFSAAACAPAQPANATVHVQPAESSLTELSPQTNLVVVNTATGIREIRLSDTSAANKLVNILQNLATDTIQENDFFVFNYEDAAERQFLLKLYGADGILLEQTVQLDLSNRQYLIITEQQGQYSLVVEPEGGELISSLSTQQTAAEEQDSQQLAADLYAAYQQAAGDNDAAARAELFSLLPQLTDWSDYAALGEAGSDPVADLLGWLWEQRASLNEQELIAVINIANSDLDGAYSQRIQALYYDRFSADQLAFLTAMAQADEGAQKQAADWLSAELYYYAATPWQDDLPDLDQQQQAALEQILSQKDYWLERRSEDTALSQ